MEYGNTNCIIDMGMIAVFRFLRKMAMVNIAKRESDKTRDHLSARLPDNVAALGTAVGNADDLVTRKLRVRHAGGPNVAIVYLGSQTDETLMGELVLRPISALRNTNKERGPRLLDEVEYAVTVGDVYHCRSVSDLADAILSGDSVALVDGATEALVMGTRKPVARAVTEPLTESAIRGPHEGFSEVLQTNLSLLRRRIRDRSLKIDMVRLGTRSRTDVAVVYIQDLVHEELVQEVLKRLKHIRLDAILESGYIEQLIEDNPLSPFSSIGNSEVPDVVAAKMYEGRIAIVVDGTPVVLTVPMLFVESFQVAEDYYSRPFYASMVRLLRYSGFAISVLGPAVFVALSSFHQELIPTPLLITMVAAAEGTPFPVVIEALVMGFIFEIVREAGVRLPSPVGQAVSIVGTLVIGQAAIQAGLVGAPVIIVIAITALASFLVVPQLDAAAILRFGFTILAGLTGLYGIMIGLVATVVHLTTLRSFGAPYLSPLAPLSVKELQDTAIRAPLWMMLSRPRVIGWKEPDRMASHLRPGEPDPKHRTVKRQRGDRS